MIHVSVSQSESDLSHDQFSLRVSCISILLCLNCSFVKMVFNCCHCEFDTDEFEYLIRHYRFEHGSDPHFRIVCGINSCAKKYSNVRVFRRHIKQKHELWYERMRQNNSNDPHEQVENPNFQVNDNVDYEREQVLEQEGPNFDVNKEI